MALEKVDKECEKECVTTITRMDNVAAFLCFFSTVSWD